MGQVVVFCRPGFEADAGRELTDVAAAAGVFGYFTPMARSGVVQFHVSEPAAPQDLLSRVALDDLVFIRDWFVVLQQVLLPAEDRVGAVIEALQNSHSRPQDCARVEVRLPEDHADRDLANFARKWTAPLARGLRGAGLLTASAETDTPCRLEVLLLDFETALIGLSHQDNRCRYIGGIPRLRLPASAPSRSALKLEEAWKVFLPGERELDYLGGGKKAVDLGAAPGGWTWQLVRQGMLVSAIDNGPMNPDLMASGQVEHIEADGYLWKPKRAVDWMVCDIVDHPRKTATMAVAWVTGKHCRFTIFNLKFPMKKRYDEWLKCREIIVAALEASEFRCRFRARHLYHDREEITCFIERLD